MIKRLDLLDSVLQALSRAQVVLVAGPRQSGKTTLAREIVDADATNYFDLEDPTSLARLDEPMTALARLSGFVVIDEVQRRPDLFPVLRVLADRPAAPTRFLVLGSASGDLLNQTSESLAGRLERITVGGLGLAELGPASIEALWLRGGFPRSYLATTDEDSALWRGQFIQSLVERDLPQWGVRVPATTLRRFWMMLAHYHGQTWNAADPARALGVSEPAVRRYLDVLSDAFMVRQLQPWQANIGKRQVKSPKVYIRDSGLFHRLLGLDSMTALVNHPSVVASWEGFVIEQILAAEPHDEAFFWRTHQGAEIDLVLRQGDVLVGVECKRVDTPAMTPSIRHALEDLRLERVAVVYPGDRRYWIADHVEAVPVAVLATRGSLLRGS